MTYSFKSDFVCLRQVVRNSDKTVGTLIISTNAKSSLCAFLAGDISKSALEHVQIISEEYPRNKKMVSSRMGAGRRRDWGRGRVTVHYMHSV